jgi:very-short-patch-repair endonuclease
MHPNLIGLIVLLIVLISLGEAFRRKKSAPAPLDEPWPLESKGTLLTEPEQRLYRLLVEALPQHRIFPQVQLLQTLRFKQGRWNPSIANRFNQLSIDFLIVRPDTTIVAAVELDDASHARANRQTVDARKTHTLESAGIPLLRWSVRQLPEVSAIASALDQAIGRASPESPSRFTGCRHAP